MVMLFEIPSSLVGLITKPFQLVELSCRFGMCGVFIVVQTWMELLRSAIYLHFVLLWKLVVCAIAVLCFPLRSITALYRERLLETQLNRMKTELENVIWERKELVRGLNTANKERIMVEAMLMELEDEHDEAIAKMELLEGQVQDLKEEMQRLNQVRHKALWNYKDQRDGGGSGYRTESWISGHASQEMHDTVKYESKILHGDDIFAKQREIARSRSLFSAVLSLVVGIIVWEAEDPCVPLVVALFIVVSMSLTSVMQYFSTIEHEPVSEAVVLLSFNWFILGTLTYPTLPKIAHALAPFASSLLDGVL